MGTWCEREVPSVGLPSTSFGPVHPLGERKIIMGQRGRALGFDGKVPADVRLLWFFPPPDLVSRDNGASLPRLLRAPDGAPGTPLSSSTRASFWIRLMSETTVSSMAAM